MFLSRVALWRVQLDQRGRKSAPQARHAVEITLRSHTSGFKSWRSHQTSMLTWHHGAMRELVYLSQSKLQQFTFERPRRWRGRAQVEGEIGVPGLGAVKVAPAVASKDTRPLVDLEKVISSLESSSRAAQWFADERAQAGQWVRFTAPLSYTTFNGAVLFLDNDRPTPAYPTGGALRLMLHGSREHLVGTSQDLSVEAVARHHYLSNATVSRLLRSLHSYLAATQRESDADGIHSPQSGGEPALPPMLERLVVLLGSYLHLEYTVAWMAGYARVTAVVPVGPNNCIMLATPLFVEYTPSPASSVEGP